MIYAVVAFDNKQGIATDRGIPWHLPDDLRHYRELTLGHDILMGHDTYREFEQPMQQRRNFVWCRPGTLLRDGFLPVYNLDEYLLHAADVWVIGGAGLFKSALSFIDEIHLTRINADYQCTKFFPLFTGVFEQVAISEPQNYRGTTFWYETWIPQNLNA